MSDIYGNLEALIHCLNDIDRSGVDRIVNLGDAIGYGPQPEEVLVLLEKMGIPNISANAVKIQIWIAMIVYLILAIIKERYRLESSLSQLLHFWEVNLFEQKSLVSIFSMNSRRMPTKSLGNDNQLKLFDY